MNIAILPGVFFPEPGGAQVQVHNLANSLVKKGHSVDVFLLNKTNIKNNLYNIIILNKIILSLVFYTKLIFKIDFSFILKFYFKLFMKNKKYDVFHFQLLNFKMILIIKILKKLNQKIIVTFQGIDIQIDRNIQYGYRLNKYYDKIFQNFLNDVNLFFSISQNITKDLIKLNIKKEKIIYMPNSVNIEKIQNYTNRKVDDVKHKLNLITVARYAKAKKGLDLIQKISKKLIDNKINFKWHLVGKNSDKILDSKFLRNYSNFFEIFKNIENIDEEYYPHSDLIKIYKKCDLYINLSRIESFGITIIEGLASNLPVITFDTKGGNELIVDNYNGSLIKDYDIEEITRVIIKYYKNLTLINSLKKNTLESIKKFDLNKITNETVANYKRLISN